MPQAASRNTILVRVWITFVAALLGFRFFRFIWLYAVNIPFWDQWDFLSSFFAGDHLPLSKLFLWQHGPHREGLGLIADRYLYAATAMNIRAESFFLGGCIFAAMLLALALKRKLFGRFSWTDAAIPVIFLTLVQWETMVGTPNPAYSAIPVVLILLYSLALLAPGYRLRYAVLLALDFLLIYTGFGLFMGIVTIGVFGLECYWRLRRWTSIPAVAPWLGLALAGACLGSFFLHYTFSPAADCFAFPHAPFKPYLTFFAVMFANFSGIWLPARFGWTSPPATLMMIAGSIPALLLGVVFLLQLYRLLQRGRDRRAALVAAALIAYSGLFALNTSIGRACLGPGLAFTSRYATLLIPAFLGLYLSFCELRVRPALRVLAIALLAVLLVPGGVITPGSYGYYVLGKRAWAACYREDNDIAACDARTHFQIYPQPAASQLKRKLDYLKQHHLSLFAEP
jgi:hypothetical protein